MNSGRDRYGDRERERERKMQGKEKIKR
jgi:hypothetical protein